MPLSGINAYLCIHFFLEAVDPGGHVTLRDLSSGAGERLVVFL